MKIQLSVLREILSEAFELNDDQRRKLHLLEAIIASKRPCLRGLWKPVTKNPPGSVYRSGLPDCWSAEHPTIGMIYLSVYSDTSHKKIGRLRDPSGTRNRISACLSVEPFRHAMWDAPLVAQLTWIGESRDREAEKYTQFRTKMHKLFGIDPYTYKGKLFDDVPPPTAPKEIPVSEPETVTEPATSTEPKISAPGEKLVKLYGKGPPGKRDVAKLHTGHKGKFYLAPDDTKFRVNDRAKLSLSPDGRLKVSNTETEHAQDWEPSER